MMAGPDTADRFRARWESLHGLFWEAAPDRFASVLEEALRGISGEEPGGDVLVFEAPAFGGIHLHDRLIKWGWNPIWVRPSPEGPVNAGGERWERPALKAAAAKAVVGFSAGAWAVAHTGTVAFYGDADHGLWPSLLPPGHLIWLDSADVLETLAEGLGRLGARPGGPPPQVKLVGGPSSTGDIEGESVIGVHGPKRVGIVMVEGGAPVAD